MFPIDSGYHQTEKGDAVFIHPLTQSSVDRIALLPGERRYQQSSIQRKTCNPVYNENFGFCVSGSHLWRFSVPPSFLRLLCVSLSPAQVSHKELSEQTVKLSVVDNGRPRKRQTIGHLLCSLKELSVENGKQVGPLSRTHHRSNHHQPQ